MIKADIDGIFQTPIYRTKITQDFSKKQLSFIDDNRLQSQNDKKTRNKSGNITSSNKNILDEPVFKNLKQEIDLIIEDYFEKIIVPSNNITPYITQSWLNYTESGQFHHTHAHANSLVSGVLYIDCHESLDKIKFYKKNECNTITPRVENFNHFNSESWWFTVRSKEVIMFPSTLTHGVDVKVTKDTRISLAFNIFVKGNLGTYDSATELIL